MKYIDEEHLRKKVRRLEKAAHKSALSCADSETRRFHEGKDFAYQYVGALIASLQQERPEVDLEMEIEQIIKDEEKFMKFQVKHQLIRYVARHFYKLGCRRTAEKYDEIEYNRQRAEESVPNDLEEAAHSYSESDEPLYSPGHRFHWDSDSLFGKQIETTFKAGAKWQAEQDQETIELAEDHAYFAGSVNEREKMLKEAVEAEVESFSDMHPEISIPLNPTMFKPGDKVRIIVIPNTDEK